MYSRNVHTGLVGKTLRKIIVERSPGGTHFFSFSSLLISLSSSLSVFECICAAWNDAIASLFCSFTVKWKNLLPEKYSSLYRTHAWQYFLERMQLWNFFFFFLSTLVPTTVQFVCGTTFVSGRRGFHSKIIKKIFVYERFFRSLFIFFLSIWNFFFSFGF